METNDENIIEKVLPKKPITLSCNILQNVKKTIYDTENANEQ